MEEAFINGMRPEYIMESCEDVIYHDNGVETEPELCAFTKRMMVFNKAIKWLDEDMDDCIICYSDAGDLNLTGDNQASVWHSDPVNVIDEHGGHTRFIKKSMVRQKDCAVLPSFQFHLGQHPVIELSVSEATDNWQFCIFIKGRSGYPVLCSGWKIGPCNLKFDISAELERKGFDLQFAELHFVIGTWNSDPKAVSSITFRLCMPGQPALVSCLPVIRTERNSSSKGLPVATVVVNEKGERLGCGSVKVFALLEGCSVPLEEKNKIWRARLNNLKTGDYRIMFFTEGEVRVKGFTNVRVTDGKFYSYNKEWNSLVKDCKITGPMSGSFQGAAFFRDVGLTGEKMINGQKDWDSWERTQSTGEHMHFWEGMTEDELEERFAYLEQCGWNLLHVCQHFGNWMRLDAGGRISPHGAEQLALYMRLAAKHGLAVLQALSHYPYGTPEDAPDGNCTFPYSIYFDEGFKSENWFKPGSRFDGIFHNYLCHYISLFREETALFAMTTSGEGDFAAGKDRVNDTCSFVKALDKNHLFIAEPILRMQKLPREYYEGWEQEMYGSRVYWVGDEIYPEFDLGIEFKFMQLGPVFMGEGSWPCPPAYLSNTKSSAYRGDTDTWCGTLRYRNRLRDSIYLGLIHRTPLILTWDEQIAEDERIVFEKVRKAVDWSRKFMQPDVSILVDSSVVTGEGRRNLAEYEKAFTAMSLNYRYILSGLPEVNCTGTVIDGRLPFIKPGFQAEGGVLPDTLKDMIPVKVSDGYNCSYLRSEDRQMLLAYIYNSTDHIEAKQSLAGTYHRIPHPVPLKLSLVNLPGIELEYIIYDLNVKTEVRQGYLNGSIELNLGSTEKDYFVLVMPFRT